MNRAERLTPLADYAGKLETEAARRLASSARALAAKEKELEQMRGYLAEYRRRAALAHDPADPLRWQNERAFLAKLSELVAAREAEVARFVENYRIEADRWRESHRRTKSLDKLIADDMREAQASEAKREQHELDERTLWSMLERG